MSNGDVCFNGNCVEVGKKFCAACRYACYCSADCQKQDWKAIHKKSCMKSRQFLPIDEVSRIIKKSVDHAIKCKAMDKNEQSIKILEDILVFAEHQYGEPVSGQCFRTRENGDRIDNWKVVTMPLCIILMHLTDLYIRKHLPGSHDTALVYALKASDLIEPNRDSIESGELDYGLTLFFQTQLYLAEIYREKFKFDKAEYHCIQSLAFAKRSRNVDHVNIVFEALKEFSTLRRQQIRLPEAIALCEEAYILVSEMHGPVHPLVQEAAAELIECLIWSKEHSRAEGYARLTCESLIDPKNGLDPRCEAVARGMQQLAHLNCIIAQEGGVAISIQSPSSTNNKEQLIEAEQLIMKACRIMENLHGPSSANLAICLETYGQVLTGKGEFNETTKEIFERVVAIYKEFDGGDGQGTSSSLCSLGEFCMKWGDLMPVGEKRMNEYKTARNSFEIAVRIGNNIFGLTDPRTLTDVQKFRSVVARIQRDEEYFRLDASSSKNKEVSS